MSRLVAGLLAGLAGAAALVQPAAAAPAREATEAADGVALLSAAAEATYNEPYTGVQQVEMTASTGRRTFVVDVRNWPGARVELQVRASPAAKAATLVEPSPPVGAGLLTDIDAKSLAVLAANFRVVLAGRDVVAGRPAQVVEIRRPAGAVAARVWIDAATKLPLQRVMLDPAGRTVRSSTFTSVRFGVPTGGWSAVRPAAAPGEVVAAADLARMRDGGWVAPDRLPSGLDLIEARRADAERALHLSYSDGLTDVSLFEESGRLDTGALGGWSRQVRAGESVWVQPGLSEQVSWSARGRVYTVVGEDRDAVDRAIAALPHGSAHRGVLSRLGRGMARVVSWFNPFG